MKATIVDIIGNNLKRYRLEKGLSQKGLSELSKIDNADISRIESGQINITLRSLEHFARALDINEWELLAPRD